MAALVGGAVVLAGLALYAQQRGAARPRFSHDVLSQDREEAIKVAALRVSSVTGMDVSDWRAFATGWSDTPTLRAAHQLECLERAQPWLSRWGLVASWRIRFVGRGESVVVGLAPGREVNHLTTDGRTARTLADYGEASATNWFLKELDGETAAGVWSEVEPVASDRWAEALCSAQDPVSRAPAVFEAAGGELRLQVRALKNAVVDVRAQPRLSGGARERYERAERREAQARRTVLIAMVLAIGLAGGIAVLEGTFPDLAAGLVLAALTSTALIAIEPSLYAQAVVETFDLRSTLTEFRRRHRRQCLLAAVVAGGFVLVCAALGGFLLSMVDHRPSQPVALQVLTGVATAAGWLGLSAAVSSWLRRRGRLSVLPELPPRALRRLGQSWPHVASVSTQSAVGEEALFRLLALPLVWHLTAQPLVGVAVSAGLWACLHDTSDVRPRLFRLGELWLLGGALGALLVGSGFAAALAAHFTHNLVVLGAPLASRSAPRPGTAWSRAQP